MCKRALQGLLEEYEAAWCSPVKLEVLGGARIAERKTLMGYFEILPYFEATEKDWDAAVANSWRLREKGQVVKWNDLLIATIAMRRDMRVFARDKHFQIMSETIGLRLYEPGYGGSYSAG